MQKENEIKAERKTQHNTSKKLFNEAHRRAEALVEIQVFTFLFYFFYFVSLKQEAHQFSAQLDRRCGL
jgi:hypothetical protein